MDKALLIGNGINLLDTDQSVTWGSLLEKIKEEKDIEDVDLDNDFKPFPLAFEELLHRKEGRSGVPNKTKILKKAIRRIIQEQLQGKPGYNEFHQRIAQCSIKEIFTTNYDYGIENSAELNFSVNKKKYAEDKTEQLHSVKRRYRLNDHKRIWHIHGELEDSRNLSDTSSYYHEESIMIGYHHYSSYLERIQELFRGKPGRRQLENQSIWTRIIHGNAGEYWFDYFFTHDIYIIGLTLDFSENHLWWLLDQRVNERKLNRPKHSISINNSINFLYPDIQNHDEDNTARNWKERLKKENTKMKYKAIASVLPAFDVEVIPIQCNSYQAFYDTAIDQYFN